MRTKIDNNILTIFLEGRIDTNNAPTVEAELFAHLNQNPGAKLALDASALEYISSAGLRVLMKLRKQTGAALPVDNVSPEVYEIFETTPIIMDRLLRGVVIPNEQAIRYLYKTM